MWVFCAAFNRIALADGTRKRRMQVAIQRVLPRYGLVCTGGAPGRDYAMSPVPGLLRPVFSWSYALYDVLVAGVVLA